MEKKFEKVAANENNPKWEKMIQRNGSLSKRKGDLRTEFERDYTRIIYATGYRRLKHKTQVFFSPESDHVCTRIEHVNYVESISYTIANNLGLNTELTKAIAVAHDIGHSPFGHQGEKILDSIMQREISERFWHERNGINVVDNLNLLESNTGKKQNLNLTYAVRDGIISHCGEVIDTVLFPRNEAIDLEKEYLMPNQYAPYTWEGCVVKLSDKISYLGRDLEDSLTLKILNKKQVEELKKVLNIGHIMNNSNIIHSLITDLCANSSVEEGLKFSDEKREFLHKISKFYIENVYTNEKVERATHYFKLVLEEIFNTLYREYDGKNTIKKLLERQYIYPKLITGYIEWLNMYIKGTEGCNVKLYDLNDKNDYVRSIIHYISGMTDKYAIDMYNEIISF